MIRVSNKACVRHLGRQSMKAAKTRNCIAVLAIALTTVLFTSLFTIALSINDGFQQSNFRQAGGYNHATFKSLTQEQFGEIKEDPLIKEWGLRRFIGMPTEAPFHKSHVEIGYPTQPRPSGCSASPRRDACPRRAPMRRPPTPGYWSCWGWSLFWGRSLP
ncbi:MAG: hypothetical protein ACLSCQ_03060 [Evtepia gabavorous]